MGPIVLKTELTSRFIDGSVRSLIILPGTGSDSGRSLILFHGAQESPEMILENSTISALSQELRLAVLLPDLGNSYALDLGPGRDYRSALLQELFPYVRERFPVFRGLNHSAVGGISMGGYAALSLALSHPDAFGRVFGLSGAVDLKRSAQLSRICQIPPTPGLREATARPDAPLLPAAEQLAHSGSPMPEVYLAWGDTDWFADANAGFSEAIASLGFSVKEQITPGLHDWDYWKEALPDAVRWSAGAAG